MSEETNKPVGQAASPAGQAQKPEAAAGAQTPSTPDAKGKAWWTPKAPLTAEQMAVEHANRKSWLLVVTVIAVIILVFVLLFQPYSGFDLSPLMEKFDFNALLSLVLALFSIWLSVNFYHNAAQQGDAIHKSAARQNEALYNLMIRFTKENGETLGRIEERFGERLTSIHASQTGLQDSVGKLIHEKWDARAQVGVSEDELRAGAAQLDQIAELAGKIESGDAQLQEFKAQLTAVNEEIKTSLNRFLNARQREDAADAELAGQQGSAMVHGKLRFAVLSMLMLGARLVQTDAEKCLLAVATDEAAAVKMQQYLSNVSETVERWVVLIEDPLVVGKDQRVSGWCNPGENNPPSFTRRASTRRTEAGVLHRRWPAEQ